MLLIPNRAVQVQRDSGQTFVERLTDGVPLKVEVRLGLRTEQQSEVRDGLAEGDQVIIRSRSSLEKLQQTFQGARRILNRSKKPEFFQNSGSDLGRSGQGRN